ncbi:MAG: hypothetical protein ACT4OH_00660 [Methylophilaceae bacterium]
MLKKSAVLMFFWMVSLTSMFAFAENEPKIVITQNDLKLEKMVPSGRIKTHTIQPSQAAGFSTHVQRKVAINNQIPSEVGNIWLAAGGLLCFVMRTSRRRV